MNWTDDRIKIKFDTINRLNNNINCLPIAEANRFKNKFEEQNLSENFAEHKTENQNLEDDIVRNILNDIKGEHEEFEQKIKLDLARIESDQQIMERIVVDTKQIWLKR